MKRLRYIIHFFVLTTVVFILAGCGGMFTDVVFGDVTFINLSATPLSVTVDGFEQFSLSANGGNRKLTIQSSTLLWDHNPKNSVRYEESANGDNVYYIFFDK